MMRMSASLCADQHPTAQADVQSRAFQARAFRATISVDGTGADIRWLVRGVMMI
jgi:hypothetical protein